MPNDGSSAKHTPARSANKSRKKNPPDISDVTTNTHTLTHTHKQRLWIWLNTETRRFRQENKNGPCVRAAQNVVRLYSNATNDWLNRKRLQQSCSSSRVPVPSRRRCCQIQSGWWRCARRRLQAAALPAGRVVYSHWLVFTHFHSYFEGYRFNELQTFLFFFLKDTFPPPQTQRALNKWINLRHCAMKTHIRPVTYGLLCRLR